MTDSPVVHVPVMLDEVIHWLAPRPGAVIVDGTLGGGGHTRALAERVGPGGRVLSLDRDPAAVARAGEHFSGLPVSPIYANFRDLPEVLAQEEIEAVHGVVLDLGMSSDQLADQQRGFSFFSAGPLDLRFDTTCGEPAWQLAHRLSAEHLANLIYEYGEERYSRRIARAIVAKRRRKHPIKSAAEFADVVRSAVPGKRGGHRIDPATQTFQALRIAVNEELKSVEIALRRLPDCLVAGGRVAIISFHSLEDRRVKRAFREDDRWNALTKKPLRPSQSETARNPRARSAKLRVAEKTQE